MQKLYAVVPNSIILYSCRLNHTILPVYLYSWVHQQVHNYNLVDTNISLIAETFSPNNRTGLSTRIKEVLKLFGENVPDEPSFSLKGFSQCITYRQKFDNIKPSTRLQYYFTDRSDHNLGGYTIITFDEYNAILDYADTTNYGENLDINTRTTTNPLNAIILLNLYCYLKMRINQYTNSAKKYNNSSSMHESLTKIAESLSLGPKTISKYLQHLSTIPLISINDGKGLQRNHQNIYTLSN